MPGQRTPISYVVLLKKEKCLWAYIIQIENTKFWSRIWNCVSLSQFFLWWLWFFHCMLFSWFWCWQLFVCTWITSPRVWKGILVSKERADVVLQPKVCWVPQAPTGCLQSTLRTHFGSSGSSCRTESPLFFKGDSQVQYIYCGGGYTVIYLIQTSSNWTLTGEFLHLIFIVIIISSFCLCI